MFWRRKAGLLLMGVLGSVLMALLLAANCVQAASVPVVARMSVSFPYAVEDTPLIIEGLTGYEGAYVEDCSDEEVADVAALMVQNCGEKMIGEAEITVECEQDTLRFFLTCLPAGESLVALEQDKMPWVPQQVLACTARYTIQDPAPQTITVREVDSGVLEITNLTDQPVYDIVLSHKTWSEEIGMYLGGVTYRTQIDALQPGQLLLLKPHHYAPGRSVIIQIVKAELSR